MAPPCGDRVDRAQHRPAQRMAAEQGLGEQVVHDVVGVVVHADLFQDDGALGVDVGGGHLGEAQHVDQDVDREGQVAVEVPGIEAGTPWR